MSFLEDNLSPGETLITVNRVHWIALVQAIFLCLLLLGAGIATGVYMEEMRWIFIGIAFMVSALIFIVALIVHRSTEYGLTNRRVIVKTGIISRRTSETMLTSIESLDVHQSVMGRLLNYGNLTIQGTGGSPEELQTVASPFEFRRQVNGQIEIVRTQN